MKETLYERIEKMILITTGRIEELERKIIFYLEAKNYHEAGRYTTEMKMLEMFKSNLQKALD